MAFTSIIQILKLGDKRSGISSKSGKPWEMQEAECILLNQDGTPESVGVLMLSKVMREKGIAPGIYTASFSLAPDLQTRRIGAVLTDLTPIPPQGSGRAAAPAPASTPVKAG